MGKEQEKKNSENVLRKTTAEKTEEMITFLYDQLLETEPGSEEAGRIVQMITALKTAVDREERDLNLAIKRQDEADKFQQERSDRFVMFGIHEGCNLLGQIGTSMINGVRERNNYISNSEGVLSKNGPFGIKPYEYKKDNGSHMFDL